MRSRQTIRQWRLLRLICASRYMTVSKAAARLGVSTKTIRRDVSALEESGFPLYQEAADAGRFLRLDRDWFLEGRPLLSVSAPQ
jgi:predicted DNA-binding transcriptional regulator YafY